MSVERFAVDLELAARVPGPAPPLWQPSSTRTREADHLAGLIRGAYLARRDFRRFAAFTQRGWDGPRTSARGGGPWGARGRFYRLDLGRFPRRRRSGDRRRARRSARAARRKFRFRPPPGEPLPATSGAEAGKAFEEWIAAAIAPRNVAGLADPSRRNLYPVDLQALVRSCGLLGLSRDQVEAALPRLRG